MYDINIVVSIITANPSNREQYVLSCDNDKIIFPSFKPQKCNNLSTEIIEFISSCFTNFTVSEHDFQKVFLIDVNSNNLNHIMSTDHNTINILYGVILRKYITTEKYKWHNFSFYDIDIPNELAILGETIRYAF